MQKLPKLKVRYNTEDERDTRIFELEQAREFFYGYDGGHPLVVLEGQPVYSYKELVKLANRDYYKTKEFLKVKLHWFPLGGG